MTTFAEFFGLADPRRTTLEFSPEHDADLLIDLSGKVSQFLKAKLGIEGQVPQAVIQGEFGTGKTHILRHVERVLAPRIGLRPLYLELGGFNSRSSFAELHIRVMGVLMGVLQPLLEQGVNGLDTWLDEQQGLIADMKYALRSLADSTRPQTDKIRLRAWLTGTGPTPTQARNLGLTGRLFTQAGPVELINLWKAISDLSRTFDGQPLLLLLDEGESFQRVVHPDAQAEMGSGMRRLFDAENRSLGLILGLTLPQSRESIHPMLRMDVRSRLVGKELQLEPLREESLVESFLNELWQKLRGTHSPLPLFEPEALSLVCKRLLDLRNAITFYPRPTNTTPTQRDLVRVLTFIGERAYTEAVRPPIDVRMLHRWFAI